MKKDFKDNLWDKYLSLEKKEAALIKKKLDKFHKSEFYQTLKTNQELQAKVRRKIKEENNYSYNLLCISNQDYDPENEYNKTLRSISKGFIDNIQNYFSQMISEFGWFNIPKINHDHIENVCKEISDLEPNYRVYETASFNEVFLFYHSSSVPRDLLKKEIEKTSDEFPRPNPETDITNKLAEIDISLSFTDVSGSSWMNDNYKPGCLLGVPEPANSIMAESMTTSLNYEKEGFWVFDMKDGLHSLGLYYYNSESNPEELVRPFINLGLNSRFMNYGESSKLNQKMKQLGIETTPIYNLHDAADISEIEFNKELEIKRKELAAQLGM